MTGDDVLEAIKHLVAMSSNGPLRTGSVYVDWLKARQEKKESSDSIPNDGECITMDDTFLSAWSGLIKRYSDQPRLSRQLDKCRKDLRKEANGALSLTIFMDTDGQTNWIREKKLQEMQSILTDKLATPIRLQVETDK